MAPGATAQRDAPRRAAVLGRPIAHSLSPALHRAAYQALGLTGWQYDALDCDGAGLAPLLQRCGPEWAGFSCTMPVKEAALAVATQASLRAELIGAANTLTPLPDGGWRADNTDVDGILATVAEGSEPPASLAILGAGGTARAVLACAATWGVSRAQVIVREPSRAAAARDAGARLGVAVEVLRFDDPAAAAAATSAALLVSTLPAGAADRCAPWPWRAGHAVLDVIYNPWPTALAAAAAAAGATVLTGASMLLHQAAEQVRLMTGRDAPVPAMREALRAAAPPGSLP